MHTTMFPQKRNSIKQHFVILIWLVLSNHINKTHGIQSPIKVRPLKQVELLTQSVDLLMPIIVATSEVDCALKCLDLEICHLFKFVFKYYTCQMMKSVNGKPNLDDTEIVYKVLKVRGKMII